MVRPGPHQRLDRLDGVRHRYEVTISAPIAAKGHPATSSGLAAEVQEDESGLPAESRVGRAADHIRRPENVGGALQPGFPEEPLAALLDASVGMGWVRLVRLIKPSLAVVAVDVEAGEID